MEPARRTEGGRSLLFERLVDLAPRLDWEAPPFIGHDREGLKASVAFELERLLSTRAPVDAAVLDRRERSTVDYGIPDGGAVSPSDPNGRASLARRIAAAIRAFEPRLADPSVTLREMPDRRDALTAEISGMLEIGGMPEAVSFVIDLDERP